VILTFTQRHHKLIVALECRDRSRKVLVPDVEGSTQSAGGRGSTAASWFPRPASLRPPLRRRPAITSAA
jgi:hypothetical protein